MNIIGPQTHMWVMLAFLEQYEKEEVFEIISMGKVIPFEQLPDAAKQFVNANPEAKASYDKVMAITRGRNANYTRSGMGPCSFFVIYIH